MRSFELGKQNKDEILRVFAAAHFNTTLASKRTIPALAKDPASMAEIERALPKLPTFHHLHLGDSVFCDFPPPDTVHLVLTSPPYWSLKRYNKVKGQLGHEPDYKRFLANLHTVWQKCFRCLVPGGRLVLVVGDVCLSRRQNHGRHLVVPLHAAIQQACTAIGFDNLAPIIWHKISNANCEAGGAGFLGKPYEPNAVIKNDIEYILMFRKPGAYRHPTDLERILSVISAEHHRRWFQQIWFGLRGASTKLHPAPFPEELAARLIRMFSFAGDVVLDPFLGSGTTTIAAAKSGRNSVGIEIDFEYLEQAARRLQGERARMGCPWLLQAFAGQDEPLTGSDKAAGA